MLSVIKEHWLKILLVLFITVFSVLVLVFGVSFAHVKLYENKVYSGVYIGGYHLGGLGEEDIKALVENYNNRLSQEGVDIWITDMSGNKEKITVSNLKGSGDDVKELARIDSKKLIKSAMSLGRFGSSWDNLWMPWSLHFFNKENIKADVLFDEEEYTKTISSLLSKFEKASYNANVKVQSIEPLKYVIIPESSGVYFDYKEIIFKIKDRMSELSFIPVKAKLYNFKPIIFSDEAELASKNLVDILSYGDLMLNYIDPQTSERRDWKIKKDDYVKWLELNKDKDGNIIFGLSKEKVLEYLNSIKPDIERAVQNAKFITEGDKVKEFKSSKPGISLDVEKTFKDINTAFKERNYKQGEVVKTITVSTEVVEPDIKIADINNLGITHLIGTGTSTFYNSHTNRIKNIAHAVDRLNGVLIKSGEEFSANKYAGPYTLANGYFIEQVIKGDKIENEVGGGMCQIGTTLFRMAMNSAMPITMRYNHSLVVNYYVDPVNHNPGTDATLYEPYLDLKFLNDTGQYILLETSVDFDKQLLTFSLWGVDDGRKGWYEHPQVLKWIPSGATKTVEVDTLPAGKKQCQGAFRGAVAKFKYTRVTPEGEKIERVFDSYYRPLPKICYVGKVPCKEDESCGSASSTPSVE